MVTLFLVLHVLPCCFPQQFHHSTLPPRVHRCPDFSKSSPALVVFWFGNLHFPNNYWCWISFHVIIGHLYNPFFRNVYLNPLSTFEFFCLFLCCLLGVLYIFWILILYQIHDWQIFPLILWVVIYSVVYLMHSLKKLSWSPICLFLFLPVPLVSYLRNHCQIQHLKVLSYVF